MIGVSLNIEKTTEFCKITNLVYSINGSFLNLLSANSNERIPTDNEMIEYVARTIMEKSII